jgi:hypothetical protein
LANAVHLSWYQSEDRHKIVEADRRKIEHFLLDLEDRCDRELFEDSHEGYVEAMRNFWLLAYKIDRAKLIC